jgi:regulator of cell morphogenesis and NO signaling
MSIVTTRTLGDLVAETPGRAAVFDRLGIDYCCHGQRSLEDACATAGLDAGEVAAALDLPTTDGTVGYPREPGELAEYIERIHHGYLHAELPELDGLLAKVVGVHGGRHPELAEVQRLFTELRSDLEPHLVKEERILFPSIRLLAEGTREFAFGTIANPIRMMANEHDRAGELLADLRRVTDGYTVPADGCASYQSLYERLERVESDTHEHIHLENNVLFPAAEALERS